MLWPMIWWAFKSSPIVLIAFSFGLIDKKKNIFKSHWIIPYFEYKYIYILICLEVMESGVWKNYLLKSYFTD